MSSFTRYAAVAAVVLSLGFLVASAPTPSYASIPAITGTDAVSLVLAKLILGLEVKIKDLLSCGNMAELEVAVRALVAVFKVCADDLLNIGASVAIDAEAKANIITCITATLTLLVQVCAQVSLKFGITAVTVLFAELDFCVRLLLVNLNICIDGVIALIVKAFASVTINLFVRLNLKLCLSVFGIQL